MFLAKFSPTYGTTSWRKQYSSSAADAESADVVVPYGIAATPSNRILVTGEFTGTTSFGKGSVQSAGGADGFLVGFYQ
jgi:hypothetical protein